MAEVKFYLKNPQAKKKSSIYFDFPYDGYRLQAPTDLSIHPSKWNIGKGKFKHQCAHEEWYDAYNERVDLISSSILKFYSDKKASGVIPVPNSIKEHLKTLAAKSEEETQRTFFSLFDKFLEIKGNEVSERTIMKYRTLKNLLVEFEASYNRPISFETVDLTFFDDFKQFLYSRPNKKVPSGSGMLDPTVNKYISVLKTFMSWAADRDYHDNQAHQKFSVPIKKKEEIITLTMDDVNRIMALDLSMNGRLDRVRDLFLFGFHTLQRWSDIERFNKSDVYTHTNHTYAFWKFESFKTKEEIIVPFVGFSKPALTILERYAFNLPKFSPQKFNDYLKELGKLADLSKILKKRRRQANREIIIEKRLYEFMSSHIMRRSGITFLLEQGVPPTTILKLTGHEDLSTLMKYENTSVNAVVTALKTLSI